MLLLLLLQLLLGSKAGSVRVFSVAVKQIIKEVNVNTASR